MRLCATRWPLRDGLTERKLADGAGSGPLQQKPAGLTGGFFYCHFLTINIAVVDLRREVLSWRSSFGWLARYSLLLGFSGSHTGQDCSHARTMLRWSTMARPS
jgi:hypothetical protein